MSLNSVTPGKNVPESFNVVIEIPKYTINHARE